MIRSIKIIITVFILTILAAEKIQCQEIATSYSFLTGNDYLKKTQHEQTIFCMGMISGLAFCVAEPNNHRFIINLSVLLSDMTAIQIHAIINKYLNNNPENWHQDMTILTLSSMRELYKKKYKKSLFTDTSFDYYWKEK